MEINLDVSFNMKDHVKMRLTNKGLETYIEHWAGIKSSVEVREEVEKNDGFISMQMWQAMAIFGPHSSNGEYQQIVGNRLYLIKFNAVMTLPD